MSEVTPFVWPVRVYYEDTDAGGVVYHSQYLNFMERARTEWLRALGFEQSTLKDMLNIVFVVHSLDIQFKKPAVFDDHLEVHTQMIASGKGSFTCEQIIYKASQIITQAQVKIACVNTLTFKPTAIPATIKSSMESV